MRLTRCFKGMYILCNMDCTFYTFGNVHYEHRAIFIKQYVINNT